MLLGVIPTFSFEFLRVLEKKRKKEKQGKSGLYGLLHRSEGLPRRGEAEGSEKAPFEFAKA